MSDPVALDTNSPLPCPKCQKLFRLPEGFTSANALACPHCQQQVTGHEILVAMTPTATIVDVPVATATGNSTGGVTGSAPAPGARPTRSFDEQNFVIPKPLKTAQRRSRSRHPERKSALTEENADSKGSSSSSSSASGSSGSSRSRSSSKKKTPEASPLGEVFKIFLGGILAIPIAQLVLWWAFNSDPLGLAPKTSQFAAFLVPPRLQPAGEVVEDEKHDKDMPSSQQLHDDNGVPMIINPK